tara:strand:- start:41710 stop:42333 length:624 start_codon:yes stop_codon:yes gene_type:complete
MKPANNYGNATFLTDEDADVAAFIRSHPVLHEAIALCESYLVQRMNPRKRKYFPADAVEISKRNFVKECNLQDCFEDRKYSIHPHTGNHRIEYVPKQPYGADYVICRGDDDVFAHVMDEIRESLHHFVPSFVANYTAVDAEVIKLLQPLGHANIIYQMLQHPQEPTLRRLVDDAIQTDGAAHFLATYDGEEIEIPTSGETYYIYRRD